MKHTSLALLAIAYLIVRFGFTRQLDGLGIYSAYILEVICVAIAATMIGRSAFAKLRFSRAAPIGAAIALASGFAIYKGAGASGIPIPFDLQGTETIIFLLIVAPILEEAVFRFFLWQPLQIFMRSSVTALIITSLIFSYSHFHAIWFVPPEIQNFIVYQTTYTLFLGLACGYFVHRYSSLVSAMIVHFSFNLGFYLGSLA